MTTLAIDIETYSSIDLKKFGVYKYVEAPDFTVLMMAYSIDRMPVMFWDFTLDEQMPKAIAEALVNPDVLKTAANANFERTCLAKFLNQLMPAEQWECSLVKGGMLGLPMTLDAMAKVLEQEQEKNAEGKKLIDFFCKPCKPTKTNGGRTRNLPQHDYEKWERFGKYCEQDVVVEQAIRDKIAFFQIPANEQRLWRLDQKINDTGILLDPSFVANAIRIDTDYKEKLTKEALHLTGLNNPNSPTQLRAWLTEETGEEVKTLRKGDIPALLASCDSDTVTRVLELRQEMSKTSVKKYESMRKCICADNRVRGLLQFVGANRTWRWAGRLIQVQNLPRNELKDLDLARQYVVTGDADMLELQFGNVPDTLSQLVRTAFVAPPGHRFIVADFSAIEAVIIAWLSGERWRMEVFTTHGKIYEASAAQMFHVPIETIAKGQRNYDMRQRGKVAELALGYQGGPNALITMGALEKGLSEAELPRLVKMWRNANKKIVQLWYDVQNAAIECVRTGQTQVLHHGITFSMQKGMLKINLPSGRSLCYVGAKLVPSKFEGDAIQYEGMNQTTKRWETVDTYGGKIVENIVQAIARDCLAVAMLRLDDAGYNIVMHIHDEAVLQVPDGSGSTEEVNEIMGQPMLWAKGLPLKAESYETLYYKKD